MSPIICSQNVYPKFIKEISGWLTHCNKKNIHCMNFLYYLSAYVIFSKNSFFCASFLFESGCKVTSKNNTLQIFWRKFSFKHQLFLVYLHYSSFLYQVVHLEDTKTVILCIPQSMDFFHIYALSNIKNMSRNGKNKKYGTNFAN